MNSESAPLMPRLLDLIFPVSPYDGFPAEQYASDRQGLGGSAPILRELVEAQRPRLVVEVGTFEVSSAIEIGRVCRDFAIPCEIVCVSTWLGDPAAMTIYSRKSWPSSLPYRWGYSRFFHSFLRNVVDARLEDRVTPLPQTSEGGAQVLGDLGVAADLVYVDAGRDADSLTRDLWLYWELLAPDGIIFGDGYREQRFPRHCEVVRAFAAHVDRPLYVRGHQYAIGKLAPHRGIASDLEDEEAWWRFLADTYARRSAGEPQRPDGPLILHGVRPNRVTAGQPFRPQPDGGSAISVRCDNATPMTLVQFDGVPLRTRFGSATRLTASLPLDCYRRPGRHVITLRDPLFASNEIDFVVVCEGNPIPDPP